jgi:hypothetical protein
MPAKSHYIAAGVCIAAFIAAQTFQDLAYRFWIPAARTPQDELLGYLLPFDQLRALAIMSTVVLLIVPFVVIALRYRQPAPVASALGLIFGVAFIGFETIHRSTDFFVVGRIWAHEFARAANRDAILLRYARWNEMLRGWFFPQLLSYLLASCAFAVATGGDIRRARWLALKIPPHGIRWVYYLAPIAYALNALRLLGRVLSNYAGQSWLNGLNDNLYFPGVFAINTLLAIWFFCLAKYEHGNSAQN